MVFLMLDSWAMQWTIGLAAVVWFLLPTEYREVFARHAVVLVGLWHWRAFYSGSEVPTRPLALSCSKGRRVSFGHVEILEFPTILDTGDNPSTREGAPVTLGWNLVRRFSIPFHWMITEGSPTKKARVLSAQKRELLLLSKGYTFQDIDMAAQRTYERQSSKRSAAASNNNSPFLALRSKVRGMVVRRRTSRDLTH